MNKRSIYTKDGIIHYNPVAVGLCTYAEEYKYSSAKFYESGIDDPILSDLVLKNLGWRKINCATASNICW